MYYGYAQQALLGLTSGIHITSYYIAYIYIFSLRDFVHSGYCDPQRRRLLALLLALALLASSQIVSPPKI